MTNHHKTDGHLSIEDYKTISKDPATMRKVFGVFAVVSTTSLSTFPKFFNHFYE